ncbi:hypothetical protein K437DRAFT_9586 [Tilletiaria anomala UBC 951]|uniref:Lytic polysaccharide monooxygenase n=1 Tax=Tilletiaria anomala (strain ATCC 24038 / CBS 436.72 / UBC 951) TaxID=1037660 RepID=A0A066VH19_TILAU|nr:uncharacterized protein K437DRAFT_9586 [Tilletiaria anomala UBC 951]KDN39608.1 hypothetical protein K437DRAFT_9586 [Tilletiaria anomala UBC 951]
MRLHAISSFALAAAFSLCGTANVLASGNPDDPTGVQLYVKAITSPACDSYRCKVHWHYGDLVTINWLNAPKGDVEIHLVPETYSKRDMSSQEQIPTHAHKRHHKDDDKKSEGSKQGHKGKHSAHKAAGRYPKEKRPAHLPSAKVKHHHSKVEKSGVHHKAEHLSGGGKALSTRAASNQLKSVTITSRTSGRHDAAHCDNGNTNETCGDFKWTVPAVGSIAPGEYTVEVHSLSKKKVYGYTDTVVVGPKKES